MRPIFVGVYLYGWNRLPPRIHQLSGLPMIAAGVAGAFFVVAANGWMNTPTGFEIRNGQVVNVDPWAAMLNPSTASQSVHMILAAIMVTGFCVASVYAVGMLRGRRSRYHRLGLLVPLTVAAVAAPISLGGIYLDDRLVGAIEIPYGLSLLIHHDPNGFVAATARWSGTAIATAVLVGVVALAGIAVLRIDAPALFDGLISRGLPVILASAAVGIGAIVLLVREWLGLARVAAALAVTAVIWGWAVAQYPYLLAPQLTIAAAAAPETTLRAMLISLVVGAALLVPSLVFLFALFQRGPAPLNTDR